MTTRNLWPAIIFALAYPTVLTWVYFVALAGEAARIQQSAYTVGKLIQFGFPVVWAWLYRYGSFKFSRPRMAGVAVGLAFGAAVGGGMLLAYHLWLKPSGFFDAAAEPIMEKVKGMGLLSPAAFIVLGVFYALAHSFLEEYYWRWFVFARLAEVARLPAAIVVSSLGFMSHHVVVLSTYFGWASPATWLFSSAVAIGGAAWALLYHRSQSLVGPWLSHLLVDAAIFAVGYDLLFGHGQLS